MPSLTHDQTDELFSSWWWTYEMMPHDYRASVTREQHIAGYKRVIIAIKTFAPYSWLHRGYQR